VSAVSQQEAMGSFQTHYEQKKTSFKAILILIP